ncbi:MAG TPA: hypothetical protein VEJ41_08735, partial [Candidatus Acidoferrales bacterium]|nr:hypothetical protein [Candidatus Acidoferrales bacterium]
MNPKLGICFALACIIAAGGAYGCHSSTTATVTPTPTATGTGPDTLYVQTAQGNTSGQVRIYQHVSTADGFIVAAAVLPTSDISNPDVVFSPVYQVLWYPSAYPQPSPGMDLSTPIRIWDNPISDGGMNPNVLVPYKNGQGTATYDVNHDLLYVANVNGPTIQVFADAHALTSSSTAAANITLTITDPNVVGTPRAAEMLYDPTTDRLFVSDLGQVVAAFDSFGTQAATAVADSTNPTIPASREMSGLFAPQGMAYSEPNDVLYVSEHHLVNGQTIGRIDVVHNASTASGIVAHNQIINGFTSGPAGMTYDAVRDLLFAYDGAIIWVIPNPENASGAVSNITNHR